MTDTTNPSNPGTIEEELSDAEAAELSPPDLTTAGEAFQQCLPEAQALAPGALLSFRADSVLAHHNLKRGLDAVLPQMGTLSTLLLAQELERRQKLFEKIYALSLALIFIDIRATQLSGGVPGTTNKKLAEARKLRRIMLGGARLCADAGLVPEREVREIERGTGARDTAKDCIALSAFYKTYHAQLSGRTPVTAAQIARADELGTELLTLIKSDDLPPAPNVPEKLQEAIDLRNRFWTLVFQAHRELWITGVLLFGPEGQHKVPALQSRVRRRAKAQDTPPKSEE